MLILPSSCLHFHVIWLGEFGVHPKVNSAQQPLGKSFSAQSDSVYELITGAEYLQFQIY